MLIYVSGPITAPTPEAMRANMETAMAAGCRLFEAGHTAFVPHTSCAMHWYAEAAGCYRPHWSEWIALDLALLPVFGAVLRLPGASKGADIEVERALALGIPVYTDLDALCGYTNLKPALFAPAEEGEPSCS